PRQLSSEETMGDARIQHGSPTTVMDTARDNSVPRWRSILRDDPPAMSVFLAWEGLRVVYNLVLIAVVVALLGPTGILQRLPYVLEGALVANVCFCAGPVAEGYLCLFGVSRPAARTLIFV